MGVTSAENDKIPALVIISIDGRGQLHLDTLAPLAYMEVPLSELSFQKSVTECWALCAAVAKPEGDRSYRGTLSRSFNNPVGPAAAKLCTNIKAHRTPVEPINLQRKNDSKWNGLAAWAAHELNTVIADQKRILQATEEFVQRVRQASRQPGTDIIVLASEHELAVPRVGHEPSA